MALTESTDLITKRYRLVFSHDNNYCTMPTYLYNTSSNKMEVFSSDTNFHFIDKSKSMLEYTAQLEKQKNAGEQNNIDIISVALPQTVFPREENTFISSSQKRDNYVFPWRDLASNRYNKVSSSQLDSETITFNSIYLFSQWSMDCDGTYLVPSEQGELMHKSDYIISAGRNILHARYGRSLTANTSTPSNAVQIQAGKGPFPDSYNEFVKDIRLIYKDYSILPEFIVSDKIRDAITQGTGFYSDSFNTLSLYGTSSYSNEDFLERYVHSDYIDSSDYVGDNFDNYGIQSIKFTVNGVKKLLPYDGFYPQQRVLQISTLFSQSIAPSTSLQGTYGTFRTVSNWIYSRGLFNSIRAGIACDMPIWQSGSLSPSGSTYDRLPFKALLNPNSYIPSGYQIVDKELENDTSPATVNSTASFGQSDLIYDLAINNFVSETTRLFLDDSKLTSIKSKPADQWTFNFDKYCKYSMNVLISKNPSFTNHDSVGYYGYPYNYFAPPYYAWTDNWTSGNDDASVAPSASWDLNRAIATITFDFERWSDTITNLSSTPTPTIDDIITYSTISFTNQNIETEDSSIITSGNFMKLDASVDLFDYNDLTKEWNIHTIWETPVHNFVGVSTLNTASQDGGDGTTAGDVHRGMWHQYTTNTVSGLNLLVEFSSSSDRNEVTGSLIEACGFEIEPKTIGNIANRKNIYEYVVVIPYTVDDCQEETYFKIPLDIFEAEYKRVDSVENDNSIRDLIRKSRQCVLPPRLNFTQFRDMTNKEILDEGQYSRTLPPFAMYIFEFSSTLSRQDMSNIWQGVSPSLTDVSEFQSIDIEHKIRNNEVLNPKNLAKYNGKLPADTRFKIFKVKAKAFDSYNQLVEQSIGKEPTPSNTYSYNWPNDFFSLVEMAKVNVEMTFADKENKQ